MQLEIDGARIFFDTVGSKLALGDAAMVERPSLVVLHGGPGFDHSLMRPYFDRFADTHQIIYMDHRGNGRSTGERQTWTLPRWGEDVHALCQALGVEKPVVLGLSFGGMVAMAYAAAHPEGPSKLILSSTAGRMDLETTFAAMERIGGPRAREVARRFWTAPNPEVAQEYLAVCLPLYNPSGPIDEKARGRAIMRMEVMAHFITGEQLSMDLLGGLAGVRCPTLIMAGGLDPVTPPAYSQAILQALPKGVGRLVVFDDAGHGVHRDQPERAEQVIRDFLGS